MTWIHLARYLWKLWCHQCLLWHAVAWVTLYVYFSLTDLRNDRRSARSEICCYLMSGTQLLETSNQKTNSLCIIWLQLFRASSRNVRSFFFLHVFGKNLHSGESSMHLKIAFQLVNELSQIRKPNLNTKLHHFLWTKEKLNYSVIE